MDTNYYHYPGPLDRHQAGLHQRRRLPDALRRHQRHARSTSTSRTRTSPTTARRQPRRRRYRLPARQRSRPGRLLRRFRRQHALGQPRAPSRERRHRRRRPGPQRAGDLLQAAARLGRRPQQLDHPRPHWNAGTFTFITTVAAGANGLQTMLPIQGPSGTLTAITRAGSPVTYTVQTDQGHPVRRLRRRDRHLRGDLLRRPRPPSVVQGTLAARALSAGRRSGE